MMKRLILVVIVLAVYAFGQSYGALSFGPIAPTLASCPSGVVTMTTLCTVGTAAPYTIYVSYNGGAYGALIPAQVAAPVTSVNGKTGAVTLSIQ
jgi:hypothetical protein